MKLSTPFILAFLATFISLGLPAFIDAQTPNVPPSLAVVRAHFGGLCRLLGCLLGPGKTGES